MTLAAELLVAYDLSGLDTSALGPRERDLVLSTNLWSDPTHRFYHHGTCPSDYPGAGASRTLVELVGVGSAQPHWCVPNEIASVAALLRTLAIVHALCGPLRSPTALDLIRTEVAPGSTQTTEFPGLCAQINTALELSEARTRTWIEDSGPSALEVLAASRILDAECPTMTVHTRTSDLTGLGGVNQNRAHPRTRAEVEALQLPEDLADLRTELSNRIDALPRDESCLVLRSRVADVTPPVLVTANEMLRAALAHHHGDTLLVLPSHLALLADHASRSTSTFLELVPLASAPPPAVLEVATRLVQDRAGTLTECLTLAHALV